MVGGNGRDITPPGDSLVTKGFFVKVAFEQRSVA